MPYSFNFNDIILGNASQTGHTVYRGAIHRPSGRRVVYKLNKFDHPKYSRLEVAFNGLAELFLQPHLTSPQTLVKNEHGDILGLASEHLFYSTHQREGTGTRYFQLEQRNHNVHVDRKAVATAEDIPIYFFDQFDPGFFAQLCQNERKGKISLDMDSLASVLTTSYTLEEDDLHKGNLAFYVIEKEGKPHVVFQKIDHDLMLADSVMSFSSTRAVNLRHGSSAFKITRRDLRDFPKLHDSNNHYWPTTKRYLTKPSDNKVYNSSDEIDAFASINRRPDFQQAKWRHFYKHILLPANMISQALTASYDLDNASDRAQIAMITQAVIERQACLRAALFAIPEFRHFVRNLSQQARQDLMDEMLSQAHENAQEDVGQHLQHTLDHYHHLCGNNGFDDQDTPLHTAIRLGEYSPVIWQSFKGYAEQKNRAGEKPLDLAVQLASRDDNGNHNRLSIRSNPGFIISHLLEKGVRETSSYRSLDKRTQTALANYAFPTHHLNDAGNARNARELIRVLRNVGEDTQFTLKMKKKLAVHCVRHFINTNKQQRPQQVNTILNQLKSSLNGNNHNGTTRPELQFIRQLRSRLWIIRKIRGLLGGTATQVELTELIDKEVARRPQANPGNLSMFASQTRQRRPAREPELRRTQDAPEPPPFISL